jgi:hypothetical protein
MEFFFCIQVIKKKKKGEMDEVVEVMFHVDE